MSMSSTHFSFNLPVDIILERSVSKLYLMVGVHFCATSFQLFTTSSTVVGAPPAENTLGHFKWRRPSSKIRDFCELDILSTALLLCSKLQLESLFGRRPLDREGDDICPYPPPPPTPGLQIKFYLLSVHRPTFSLSSTGTLSWPWARSWTPSRRSPTLRRTREGRPGRSVPASPGS